MNVPRQGIRLKKSSIDIVICVSSLTVYLYQIEQTKCFCGAVLLLVTIGPGVGKGLTLVEFADKISEPS